MTKTYQKLLEDIKIAVTFGSLKFDIELDGGFFGHLSDVYSEKHNHSSYEVQIITQGEGTFFVKQTKHNVRTGDCIIIERGVYHSLYGSTTDFKRIDFRFRISEMKGNLSIYKSKDDNILKDTFLNGFVYKIIFDRLKIINIVNEITNEFNNRKPCYYSAVRSLFSLLIVSIARELSPAVIKEYDVPYKVLDEKRTLLIEKFFDNYDMDLTSDDLAKLLKISKRQLNRIMQNIYNTTFKQKLIDTRIEVAKELLKNSDLNIYEIAHKVGYTSAKCFSNIFTKKVGMTPTSFRQAD